MLAQIVKLVSEAQAQPSAAAAPGGQGFRLFRSGSSGGRHLSFLGWSLFGPNLALRMVWLRQ